MFVIDGERFAPVALAAEDGVAQTVVDLDASQVVLADVLLGRSNGLLDGQAVEAEIYIGLDILAG